jgi:hypothetical protein
MTADKPPPIPETPFVNAVRLNARQWATALVLVLLIVFLTPIAWKKIERFETGPDYRIPYELSKDYWLYGRRLRQLNQPDQIALVGDSVVWGEYVLPDGTLSHYLGQESDRADQFINAGVNGLFPLALEGLIQHYGGALRNGKILLHCNLLWMSSPKADLQIQKEEKFNHSRLVPQFRPSIPCYRADASERLGIVAERNSDFLAWVGHLQNAYFDQKNILAWTLADDGGSPPSYPNSYKNPLGQVTLVVPSAPIDDPNRGPKSTRHRPWPATGAAATRFEWVGLDTSLQWDAFRRLTALLRERGNKVLVVIGPFNEHFVAEANQPPFRKLRDGAADWLAKNEIPYVAPEALPSDLYADASHPLTEGYALLAKRLYQNETFQRWLKAP